MTTNNNKPAVTIPPEVVPTKKRSFAGIEPGSLRGSQIEVGPPVDPDEDIRNKTAAMSGAQLRAWLKTGDNRQKYDAFLARRKNNDY
jgi:hypothetical protein